jgi:hypothetical protein
MTEVDWGAPQSTGLGDRPVPADFDGDGKVDIAIYRASSAEWFVLRSSNGGVIYGIWGTAAASGNGDTPVPADYDADGIADFAVFRSSTGEWFIRRSSDAGMTYVVWGASGVGDVAIPAKY